jgi:hypothetical protein
MHIPKCAHILMVTSRQSRQSLQRYSSCYRTDRTIALSTVFNIPGRLESGQTTSYDSDTAPVPQSHITSQEGPSATNIKAIASTKKPVDVVEISSDDPCLEPPLLKREHTHTSLSQITHTPHSNRITRTPLNPIIESQ